MVFISQSSQARRSRDWGRIGHRDARCSFIPFPGLLSPLICSSTNTN
jgi:hypothetical protein